MSRHGGVLVAVVQPWDGGKLRRFVWSRDWASECQQALRSGDLLRIERRTRPPRARLGHSASR